MRRPAVGFALASIGVLMVAGLDHARAAGLEVREMVKAKISAELPSLRAIAADRLPIVTLTGESVGVEPVNGAEDFSVYGQTPERVPICLWRIGGTAPAIFAESTRTGVPVPSNHNSGYAPVPDPTITAGVTTMTAAVLDLLAKK